MWFPLTSVPRPSWPSGTLKSFSWHHPQSPQTPRATSPLYQPLRGAVIVYLLFTEEKPHYFLLINNWHVWVGRGTKSHSLSVFCPSGCMCVCLRLWGSLFVCVSEHTTHWALLTTVSPVEALWVTLVNKENLFRRHCTFTATCPELTVLLGESGVKCLS